MKKLILLLVLACLFLSTTAIAQEPIPALYAPILEAWNATNTEELYSNILDSMRESASYKGHFTKGYMPLSIRIGGTTQELIDDKSNWDLAIVSSKEVDLQAIADTQIISQRGYNPRDKFALHQWLLPQNLQDLLPSDPLMMHYIYVYNYDAQSDEAIFLICQADIGRKKNHPREPVEFANEIMRIRSAETVRSLEGIHRVDAWTEQKLLIADSISMTEGMRPIDAWTEEDLIANADEWDVAILIMDASDRLNALDAAGLLYDFTEEPYFTSRSGIVEARRGTAYADAPNGHLSADGRMIGIPCSKIHREDPSTAGVLILNAKSPYLEQAHAYVVHFIKSLDWDNTAENKWWPHGVDTCLYKDEMDW